MSAGSRVHGTVAATCRRKGVTGSVTSAHPATARSPCTRGVDHDISIDPTTVGLHGSDSATGVAKTSDAGLPTHAHSSSSSRVEIASKDWQWRDEAVGGTEDAPDDTFAADGRVEPSHVVHIYLNGFMQSCGTAAPRGRHGAPPARPAWLQARDSLRADSPDRSRFLP